MTYVNNTTKEMCWGWFS